MSLQVSMIYNIGSIILGLVAWGFGGLAITRKNIRVSYACSTTSFGMCIISLLFQLLEVGNRVSIEDLSAIYDTINAVIMAAAILIIITFVLNVIALIRARQT